MQHKGCAVRERHPTLKGRVSKGKNVHTGGTSDAYMRTEVMPLPRRRSSLLGHLGPDRATTTSSSSRGVFVAPAPPPGGAGCPGVGTRVSRRALGISSVFLQGLRSSTAPVQVFERSRQPAFESLNGCLLEYRDKVRSLEQLNLQLEEQIRHCLDRKASGAGAWGALRREWEDIYRQVSEAILDNARLMLQSENVQASAEDFKERYENEQPFRKAIEEEISSLYKVIDDANVTRMDLEAQIEIMRAELVELAKNHEQDVRVLYNQLSGTETDEPDAPIDTSLDQILDHIRTHWEKAIEKNRADTDACLESKQAETLSAKMSSEEKELESLKAECLDAGCKIQSLQAETESMRALKRGLENSLNDAKHWHDIELQNLGSVISKLEAELTDIHCDIEQQRRDYESLLGSRRRLEMEIGTYHGILDGEESRCQPTVYTSSSAGCERQREPAPSDPPQAAESSSSPSQSQGEQTEMGGNERPRCASH